jgi:hypothetical protein
MLGGMHLLDATRAVVLMLLVAALALGGVALARLPSSAPTVVVVVPIVSSPAIPNPSWCYGYDWRRSSVDLRMYCGVGD